MWLVAIVLDTAVLDQSKQIEKRQKQFTQVSTAAHNVEA